MIEPKEAIKQIEPYDVPLFAEHYELKIDANENVFGCSEKVIERLKNITTEDISRYPHYGAVTKKIAEFLSLSIDEIKVTDGADEALAALIQTYCDSEDEMLTVTPSFSMPKLYANFVGAKVVEINYQKRWEFPTEDFLKEIETNPKIKVVHLTSPNNPTGECISEETAERILKAAQDKLVIFDETYGGYSGKSMISRVKDYENLAVVKSFSKDFALAGLRIGYIVTNAKRIKLLKTVISPYSVNSIAAIAAEAALSDLKHFEKVKTEIQKSKEFLTKELEKLNFTIYPSEANFILINAGEKADFVYLTLLKNGIKIREYSNKLMNGLLRITIPQVEKAKKIIELLQPKPTLIFDMDGVLVDVSNSYRTTIKKTYEFFANKEISYDKISEAKNSGGLNNDWDLTDFLLNSEGIIVDREKLINVFEKIYFNNGNGLINNEKFLANRKFFEELSKKYNLAIFTGRPRAEAIFTLKKENVEEFFYPIITMDDLPKDRQKPDSLGIEVIRNKILTTNEIFYFGDTSDDMRCGKSANVKTIGVLPPQAKSTETEIRLAKNGADRILKAVTDFTLTEEKILK
ncbi:MAG: histidinol-phosphate transaminase [Candidatus Gastranaerophilaceae bacterium]